jgi:hypothetical protein
MAFSGITPNLPNSLNYSLNHLSSTEPAMHKPDQNYSEPVAEAAATNQLLKQLHSLQRVHTQVKQDGAIRSAPE